MLRAGLRWRRQRVSVLICTHDRPDSIERAVGAVLASEGVTIDLIVVDQSEGTQTKERLAAMADDRLRCVRGKYDGTPFGLNEGLMLARHPFVVITDDDCEPPPGWVAGMVQILMASPRVALVFSNIVPPPDDRPVGWVPTYGGTTDRVVRSSGATCWGQGAGMALRRDVVLGIGGFAGGIGPGARLKSCDDQDMERRLLLKGWDVYEHGVAISPSQVWRICRSLDLKPWQTEFEYRRHGTAVLFAGLNVHAGDVAGWVTDSTRTENFVAFLTDLDDQTPPGLELHCIVDNRSAHFTPTVEQFLDERPHVFVHHTPTHASWLNQVELFFSILERRLLRHGEFDSVDDLATRIIAFINDYNRRARPFRWTYDGRPLKVA